MGALFSSIVQGAVLGGVPGGGQGFSQSPSSVISDGYMLSKLTSALGGGRMGGKRYANGMPCFGGFNGYGGYGGHSTDGSFLGPMGAYPGSLSMRLEYNGKLMVLC